MEKISVIICHHKGRLIDKAIDSILASRNVEVEVIIATSDESWLKENQPRKRVTGFYCEGGPAHKRNVAFRFAQYPLIAFFDDDIETTLYALDEMAKSLDDKSLGMVFGKLLNMEFRDRFDEAGSFLTSSGFLWARAESGIQDNGQYDSVVPILSGKSASCMVRRSVFVEVGMFDASYEILGEETDLAWRVWLSGYKVLFVPSSTTFHAFNTKFKPADFYVPRRVYFNGCRNYISMLLTNLETKNLLFPIFIQISVWIMAGIGMFLTGKKEASFNIFYGLGYVFRNLRSILKKRHKVQSSRKISDKELFKMVLRNPPISYYTKRFCHYIKTGRHG